MAMNECRKLLGWINEGDEVVCNATAGHTGDCSFTIECRYYDGNDERVKKLERELELLRLLEGAAREAEEYLQSNVPIDGWGCLDRVADSDREKILKSIRAQLAALDALRSPPKETEKP